MKPEFVRHLKEFFSEHSQNPKPATPNTKVKEKAAKAG
jgi:hypothetical protein